MLNILLESNLAGVVIGGLISAITTLISNAIQNRNAKRLEEEKSQIETKRWLRDKKESLYVELAIDPPTINCVL